MKTNKLTKIITTALIISQALTFVPAYAGTTQTQVSQATSTVQQQTLRKDAMIDFGEKKEVKPNVSSLDDIDAVADLLIEYSINKQEKVEFTCNYSGDLQSALLNMRKAYEKAKFRNSYAMLCMDCNYTVSLYKGKATVRINNNFKMTAEQEKELLTGVDAVLAQIINQNMTNVQKEKAIHDWIVNNCTYDLSINDSQSSAYWLFKSKRGVCEGYATLTKFMLNRVGIPSIVVLGQSGGTDHAWNLVYLDGEWNNLDVTWDDPVNGTPNYDFFNCSTQKMASNHIWDKTMYPIVNK